MTILSSLSIGSNFHTILRGGFGQNGEKILEGQLVKWITDWATGVRRSLKILVWRDRDGAGNLLDWTAVMVGP